MIKKWRWIRTVVMAAALGYLTGLLPVWVPDITPIRIMVVFAPVYFVAIAAIDQAELEEQNGRARKRNR